MKTKNNSKKVEKTFDYSVVDITLVATHNLEARGVYVRLASRYKLAYTDDDSLTKFIAIIKKDPIKYFRRKFCFNAPIITRVFIEPVSMDNYSFGTISTRKGYMILSECTDFHIHDLFKHNRHLIQYQPNINSL